MPRERGVAGLIAVCALALLCAGPATAAAPPLKVEGKRLVNARTGQVFVPRGVNWPSFEYACFYGYAYSDEGDPKTTHPTSRSARQIASWKVNTVRVPLNQACWLGEDGQPAFGDVNGYRAAVQDWVRLLHRAGLAVILDLHWSAPDRHVGAEGQRAMPDDRSPAFWTSVATTFKDDRSIIFDLFNEPYSRYDGDTLVFDLTWDCWLRGGCTPPLANDNQPLGGTTYTAIGHAGARRRRPGDGREAADHARRDRLRQRPEPLARHPPRGQPARRRASTTTRPRPAARWRAGTRRSRRSPPRCRS